MDHEERSILEATSVSLSSVVARIRAEYVEMPGLALTVAQAARFWSLNPSALEQLFSILVDDGFLLRDKTGAYRRP